jgi:excinuclease ABC subunit C
MDRSARSACGLLPDAPGVYRFRDGRGRALYLGRAGDLRARTRSYWGDLRDRRHLQRMVPQIATVEALVCASTHEAAWLERNLLHRSLPRWNRTRGGEEVPVWLLLDTGPRRPGLRVCLTVPVPGPAGPGRATPETVAFGPYLGSERTRAAVSGLLRSWPPPLTGTALGSVDRDLGRARGVGPPDREACAGMLRRVLDREPDAVLECVTRLEEARERAVSALVFETAQQIQSELAAVGWLTAPQRVTGCLPADLRVHGLADGVLLTVRAHDGRLDDWSVRAAAPSRDATVARTTAPGWQAFADENARLAARLARAQAGGSG